MHSPANTSNTGELASQGVSFSAINNISNSNKNVKNSFTVDESVEQVCGEEIRA